MPDALPLHDGGAYYHDDRPLAFHPGLRAAAQLLLAADRRVPELRGEVESFVDGPALRMSVLTSPSVWCDPERGLRIVPGVHTSDGRRRLREELRPFDRVVEWARERYLHSAWVIELLFLTIASWQELARRVRSLEVDLATMAEIGSAGEGVLAAQRREIADLTRAAENWGPWVDVLCGEASGTCMAALVEMIDTHQLPYLRGVEPASPEPRVQVEMEVGWQFELETWEEFEERFFEGAARALERYRLEAERVAEAAGFRPSPTRHAVHHFDWLALRQLEGWSPARLAGEFGVAVSTVHHGLSRASGLLEMELRPVKRGPQAGW